MGFVKTNSEIEQFLVENNFSWNVLNDSEYRVLMKNWKNSFEQILIDANFYKSGETAITHLISKLGGEVFIFNAPNYKYLPVPPASDSPTYGYYVEKLTKLERELFNRNEAIVTDIDFSFMCAFNHEAQFQFPELYCESRL